MIWFTTTSSTAMIGRVAPYEPGDSPSVEAMIFSLFPYDRPRTVTWEHVELWSPILINAPVVIQEGGAAKARSA